MKKRKKLKKLPIILFLFVIIIGVFTFIYFNKENTTSSKYSESALSVAKEIGITEKINSDEYSKTLEEILINNLYNDKFYDDYLKIVYLDETDFIKNITLFLDKGYTGNEINNIYSLSDINKTKLLNVDYIDFSKYITISNFNVDNYDRYEKYLNNESNVQSAVTYVNIGLDSEFYTNIEEVNNPSDIDVLINKYYKLPDDYAPTNLVSIPGYYGEVRIIEEAGNKFTEMIEAAKNDGHNFVPTTAYRDYDWQNTLYSNYVSTDGQEEADTYSARAGHSEHQTGYAIDIANKDFYTGSGTRLNDEDYAWILDNAHLYGYIVRYPKDSTKITTYMEEPWHLRYFGVDLAMKIVESNITYDEYYDLYIREY